jgi:hypothetical protein
LLARNGGVPPDDAEAANVSVRAAAPVVVPVPTSGEKIFFLVTSLCFGYARVERLSCLRLRLDLLCGGNC